MPNGHANPALADRIRGVARRFEAFAQSIVNHAEPYPWSVWGADSDGLMVEAGRLLVQALEARAVQIDGLSKEPIYLFAIAEGLEVPGWYAAVFELALRKLGMDPEDMPSVYVLHLGAWPDDHPQREQLNARAFAELQTRRGEALAAIARMADEPATDPMEQRPEHQVQEQPLTTSEWAQLAGCSSGHARRLSLDGVPMTVTSAREYKENHPKAKPGEVQHALPPRMDVVPQKPASRDRFCTVCEKRVTPSIGEDGQPRCPNCSSPL